MQNVQGVNISLIIKSFNKGSESAFKQIFDAYNEWLYGEAVAILKNADDARDIVQEVFITLWQKRADIRADGDIDGYLFTCVKHACYLKLRRQKVILKNTQDYASFQLNQPDHGFTPPPPPPDDKNEKDLVDQVREAVQAIKGDAAREAIENLVLKGESYESYALRTGQPIQSLRNARSRGISFLRKFFHIPDLP